MIRKDNHIRILDTTCRDGMHAMAHSFTAQNVRDIAAALEKAGVNYMEVSHGDGLGGSSINYGLGADTDRAWLTAARSQLKRTKLAALMLPGVGTMDELRMARDCGVEMVRVTVHCTDANVTGQYVRLVKELGMQAFGVMMTHMLTPEELLKQGRIFEDNGVDAVYMMDSAGHLLPEGVTARVGLMASELGVPVGFHAHANLAMHIPNTLAAIRAGVSFVDGTLKGLGAGAGNAPTEVLTAVLKLYGYDTDVDLYAIEDAAEDVATPIIGQSRIPTIDKTALTIGYAGVYGSFSLHAKRAAAKYGVDPRDILMACGKRHLIGGQEDIIIEEAVRLSKEQSR